jgi:hypothetical protein
MFRLTIVLAIMGALALAVGVGGAGAHKKKSERVTTVDFQDVPGPGNDVVSGQVFVGPPPELDPVTGEPVARAAAAGNCLAGQQVLVKHTLTPEGGGAAPAVLVTKAVTDASGAWQAVYEASGANVGMFDTFQIEVAKTRLKPKNARHKHVCIGAFGNKTAFSY